MTSLRDPTISILFFFSVEQVGSKDPGPICQPWERHPLLSMDVELDESEYRRYSGQTQAEMILQLDWRLAHDTHLLRLSVSLPGLHAPAAWSELRQLLDRLVHEAHQSGLPVPWAGTYLYHGLVRSDIPETEVAACLTEPAGLGLTPQDAGRVDATPYGWLWLVGEEKKQPSELQDLCYWQRTLALLTPADRAERTQASFLKPLTQGLARIELYLHKGAHHARQHEIVSRALAEAGHELQDGMLAALRAGDFGQLHREQRELEEIARKLQCFLTQKTQAEILLGSLRVNLQALTEHLERVRLEAPFYARHAAHLARHVEQLESDLGNARTISESSYSFQDIQRGVEAARLERASFLLGGAAALLAAIAIFNSFVDIWNLVMEGSGLAIPAPWLRAVLGVVAAVSWPLGAYWAMERRKAPAAIASVVGLSAFATAVVATVVVNL